MCRKAWLLLLGAPLIFAGNAQARDAEAAKAAYVFLKIMLIMYLQYCLCWSSPRAGGWELWYDMPPKMFVQIAAITQPHGCQTQLFVIPLCLEAWSQFVNVSKCWTLLMDSALFKLSILQNVCHPYILIYICAYTTVFVVAWPQLIVLLWVSFTVESLRSAYFSGSLPHRKLVSCQCMPHAQACLCSSRHHLWLDWARWPSPWVHENWVVGYDNRKHELIG